jgi:hypothetical protein
MASTKIITVAGATGNQGGSVIDHILQKKPQEYTVRAVTRNASSDAAKDLLASGVEVVTADLNDLSSLIAAFKGSNAIFAVTDFWSPFGRMGKEKTAALEVQQGKNLADAAAQTATLEHYFWSTLAHAGRLSGGKHPAPHYDSKAAVDRYIEKSHPDLYTKTTFLWCSFYASNLAFPFIKPVYVPTAGQYIQMQGVPADTPMGCIGDTRANLGAFVVASLAQPEKTRGGRIVFAFLEMSTLGGLLQTWAEAHKTKAHYLQIPKETFYSLFPNGFAEEFNLGMEFWSWTKATGIQFTGKDSFLTAADLGVDTSKLLSVRDSFAALPI